MPGRTPTEAVDFFLEPLGDAVACLGQAKITLSRGGRGELDVTHLLTLNDSHGMSLSGRLRLDARIQYSIIRDGASASQPFRITTRAYLHTVSNSSGVEVFSAHWHPTGSSPYTGPHWHIGSAALAPDGVFTPRAHLPSPRASFESVVRLLIEQFGVTPARPDWADVLDRCEGNFERHRTWG